jgi:hypothetical protein
MIDRGAIILKGVSKFERTRYTIKPEHIVPGKIRNIRYILGEEEKK